MAESKKKGSKNPNEIQRFSCGFYSYDINDIVLTNILNFTTPKHLRGSEMKRLATIGLKTSQPELYDAVYKEVANKLGISQQGIPTPAQVSVPMGATVIQGYGYNGTVESYQPIEQEVSINTVSVESSTHKVEEKVEETIQKEIKSKILEEVKPQVEENKLETIEIEKTVIEEKPKSKKKKSAKADLFNMFQSNGG